MNFNVIVDAKYVILELDLGETLRRKEVIEALATSHLSIRKRALSPSFAIQDSRTFVSITIAFRYFNHLLMSWLPIRLEKIG